MIGRRQVMAGALCAPWLARAARAAGPADPARVLHQWYRLVLELVRHTATYSPPVAARAFGHLGVIAHLAAGTGGGLAPLAPRLTALPAPPPAPPGVDPAAVVQAALALAVAQLFGNTGPTGQRAMAAMDRRLAALATQGLPPAQAQASLSHGRALAAHVLAWAATDGGAMVDNMGFPHDWRPAPGPAHWVPTSLIRQQQTPLLPHWGDNRPFVLASGAACGLPAPPPYSEAPGSAFRAEGEEVWHVSQSLTGEQIAIARFWSDDPMLSPTPPGHWIAIALAELEAGAAPLARRAEVLALLGIAMSDAFVCCWHEKFRHDLLRPVTYIRRVIDPAWQPLLITPPFPEYPSGHSTLSGAAAEVLTALFGPGHAFVDRTHEDDGLPPRAFADFRAAAAEAGISRLYGGIHFRAAVERGLDQGRCVGAAVAELRMRA